MESNNLFIYYSHATDREPAERTVEAIAGLGTARRLFPLVWLVKSDLTALEAFEELRKTMEPTAEILVVDATNDDFMSWPEDSGGTPGVTS